MTKLHGMSNTRLYSIWNSMKGRCFNPADRNYKWYGARGITVCPEWRQDFFAFYTWAVKNGYQPNAPRGVCTLDRIDPDGDYCPENCRWITIQEQERNKRNNHRLVIDGKEKTAKEWAEDGGRCYSSAIKEINRRKKGVRPRDEYLKERADEKQKTLDIINFLMEEDPSISARKIAEKIGCSKSYAARLKKQIPKNIQGGEAPC